MVKVLRDNLDATMLLKSQLPGQPQVVRRQSRHHQQLLHDRQQQRQLHLSTYLGVGRGASSFRRHNPQHSLAQQALYDGPKHQRRESHTSIQQRLSVKSLYVSLTDCIARSLNVKTVINIVTVVTVSAICIQQCASAINDYLSFQTRLHLDFVGKFSSMTELLPGITVCNNNRLVMDKIVKMYPSLGDKLADITNKTTDNKMRLKAIKEAVYNVVDMNALNNLPIPELMELSNHQDFIRQVDCNQLWGKPINCGNVPIYRSFQASTCSTIFYGGALLDATATGELYVLNRSRITRRYKRDAFDTGQVVEIPVNFMPTEYADFKRDVGGQIVLHSQRNVGSIRDLAYNIFPGRRYDFLLRMSLYSRLPPPYDTKCYDYYAVNKGQFGHADRLSPRVELDQTTCVRNCIVRHTRKQCNCWPVEVPFFVTDSKEEINRNLRLCPWGIDNILANTTASLYFECYHKFIETCQSQCPVACESFKYDVKMSSRVWPENHDIAYNPSATRRVFLAELRNTTALISIRYETFGRINYIFYPSLTLAQLVSNLGGIVSSLIGISTVTIYRYLARNIMKCHDDIL